MDTLLILTADKILPISSHPITRGGVLIKNGKIVEVADARSLRSTYPNAERMELGAGILLPGFVNAHTHLELGWITRRIGKFGGFTDWLKQIISGKTEGIERGEIESSVESGLASLIRSGVTSVGEVSSYGGIDKPILRESGVRAVLFTEIFDRNADLLESIPSEKSEKFEERPFPHAPYSCSPELLQKVMEFSEARDIPFGIHLAESREEVKFLRNEANDFDRTIFPQAGRKPFDRAGAQTPLEHLIHLGLSKNARATAVHMVQVQPQEVPAIANLGLGLALCPRSNLFLHCGLPPLGSYLKLPRVGIGTDGLSSNFNLDFLEELRFFYLTFARTLGREAAQFTVYLATLGGAKCLFLEDRIGSVEAGKEADLIFVNPSGGYLDPYLSVISCSAADVKMAMVGGEIIRQIS